MIRPVAIAAFVSAALLAGALCAQEPSGFPLAIPDAMKTEPVRVAVDTTKPSPLKPLMGYNTQFAMSRFTYDDPAFQKDRKSVV